jgi:hypothetical protein
MQQHRDITREHPEGPLCDVGTLRSGLPCITRPQKYWNAMELALLGDTIWEYYVRRHAMFPPAGIRRYRQRLDSLSTAEHQVGLSRGCLLFSSQCSLLRAIQVGPEKKRNLIVLFNTRCWSTCHSPVVCEHVQLSSCTSLDCSVQACKQVLGFFP